MLAYGPPDRILSVVGLMMVLVAAKVAILEVVRGEEGVMDVTGFL